MNKFINIIVIGCSIILVIWAMMDFVRQTSAPDSENPQIPVETVVAPEGEPVFTWSYSDPVEKDFIPYSTITLTAQYPNGAVIARQIDTIEGGCNEHPDADKDVYKNSIMIICYYAGFGRYYKVTASESGYAAQRKEFEETSPEYNPPVQTFQTISEF